METIALSVSLEREKSRASGLGNVKDGATII